MVTKHTASVFNDRLIYGVRSIQAQELWYLPYLLKSTFDFI